MFVPFQSLLPHARLWIYQSDKKLSPQDKAFVENELKEFTNHWAAHGHPLKSSFEIRFDQFILIAVEEDFHAPSGCSIDGSVRVLKNIEMQLGINFFNRNLIAFQLTDGVKLLAMGSLKQNFTDGILNNETLTFNNLIATVGQLQKEWIVPSGNTWLKRYNTSEAVNT